ncbi:MAG: hypothetical protein RJA16_1052 [Planctomycetota bacterium]|jgi:hypothetical protein
MTERFARTASRVACLVLALVLPSLNGCAGGTPPSLPAPDVPPDPRLQAALPSEDPRVGIETRQWLVAAPPERLAAAIAAWSDEAAGDRDSEAVPPSLRRIDGLLLAKGSAADLPSLLESLGGSRTDLRVWHGQATEWRDLAGVQIGRATIAMVAGRPQPIAPGRLSLVMRGWAQPMEDGAACELELGLRWKPERRASITLEDRDFSDLRWVGELATRFDVGRDEAVVVASEPPSPMAESGPPVALPPSLGRLILPEPAHGLATVLVIWPNLPARLFPDAAEPASIPDA